MGDNRGSDEYEMSYEDGGIDSQEPLTFANKGEKKDYYRVTNESTGGSKTFISFLLSVFNLMNAILGSGILGLADAMANLGVVLFLILLFMTVMLAGYTINILLKLCDMTGEKTYEGLSKKAFGDKGRIVTSIMIVFHCLGAMCSYVFIAKKEMPEVVKAFINYTGPEEAQPFYLSGNFLMILVVLFIITPLACLRDIKFLGYSSGFGMACMLLFGFTVVYKKFSIPCPLNLTFYHPSDNTTLANASATDTHDTHFEFHDEEQQCEPEMFKINSRTAYAVPTMFFSFMCHASMLPIYVELKGSSRKRMQMIANVSLFNVFLLYMCSSIFGYLTFFNYVQSELLLTYSLHNHHDTLVIVSRIMVLICVTLSVPLLHYPCRKTILITMFPASRKGEFSWIRHLGVMAATLTITVLLVMFVPNIRDIFGIAGATSSASLLVVFPCAFFIRISNQKQHRSEEHKWTRIASMVLIVLGLLFMIMSVALIIRDWVS